MLDVFILPSGMPHADYKKSAESFEKFPFSVKIKKVDRLINVVDGKRTNPFYSFFFDVEHLDSGLIKGLHMFLTLNKFDVLVLFKRNKRRKHAEFRPRIFRDDVRLSPLNMLPIKDTGIVTEHVLNGWILEHGFGY